MKIDFNSLKKMSKNKTITIAVAGSHDDHVIGALYQAAKIFKLTCLLVGNEKVTKKLLTKFPIANCKIINEEDQQKIGEIAVSFIKQNKAQVLMKGLIETKWFLKAVVNSENGIKNKNLLSHIGCCYSSKLKKSFLITDAAMNICPTVEQKWDIITNAVKAAQKLQCKKPLVGIVSASETVNPKMQSTLDAVAIKEKATSLKINSFVVDGPFAIDNLLLPELAKHKSINSPVAGKADIFVFPEIVSGNVFYKTATFLGDCTIAGVVVGAQVPIILTSRVDSMETKLNSILLGVNL